MIVNIPFKKTFLLLFSIIVSVNTFSSHIAGGDITYECLPDGRIVLTLKIFRDCDGIAVSTAQTINASNTCNATSTPFLLPLLSSSEISPLCAASIINSACNGGTLPGMQEYIFQDTVTLPSSCTTWTFEWDNCCRNNAITNFNATSASNDDTFLETTIHFATTDCNSTPVFTNQPVPFVCINLPVTYNYGAFDPEGDSLTFQLVSAMDLNASTVTYNAGYSGALPIPGITINSQTGELNFTPTLLGNFVVVVQVNEYDPITGNLLSTEIRETQFIVQNCTNQPPVTQGGGIQNATGTFNSVTSNTVSLQCSGENVCFDLVFGDTNSSNILTVTSNINSILTGAIVTQTGTNPTTVNICYSLNQGDIGGAVVFSVTDGACPVQGFNNFTVFFDIPQTTFASPGVTICGNQTAALTATNGTTFTWSAITGDPIIVGTNFSCNPCSNPIATPSQTTSYIVTSDLPACINTDTVIVSVTANFGDIFATTGANQTICAGQCVNLSGIAQEPASTTTPVTFSGGAGETITNGTPVNSAVTVSGLSATSITANMINSVCLDITHSWDSDLDIYLKCPNGTQFELTTDNGSFFNNYTSTCFTLSATTAITAGSAPFTGNFIPEGGALSSALIGCPTNGNWNLVVIDDAGGDNGVLNSWSLTINDQVPVFVPASSFSWTPTYNITNTTTLTPTVCPTVDTTYTLYAYNADNCYDTATVSVFVTNSFSITLTPTDANCSGTTDGAITTAVSGSAGPFTYNWSSGASTQNISGLPEGIYTVTISDGSCSGIASTTISTSTTIIANAIVTTPQCYTDINGIVNSISFNGTGSTSSFGSITSYSWDFGDATTSSSAITTHTYTTANTFTVSLTVSDGSCSHQTTMPVVINPVPSIALAPTNISCNNSSNGQIIASGSAGTTPYIYQWLGPNSFAGTTPTTGLADTETGLSTGTYIVTITDGNNCAVTASTSITEPSVISVSSIETTILCTGNTDGSSVLTVSGGTTGYSFMWDSNANGQTTLTATGLAANIYNVSIVDANLCFIAHNITITEPLVSLSASTTCSDASTLGASNGSSIISANGGTTPYSYLWSNGTTTVSNTGLSANTYAVTVSDANLCIVTTTCVINDPGCATSITTATTNALCNGESTGSASVLAFGGTTPYSYLWSNGQTTTGITGISQGIYNLTVTDNNACTNNGSITITEPSLVSVSSTTTNISCFGVSDGTIVTIISGGTTPYTFSWNNSLTTQNLSGLAIGTYTLTTTDANLCSNAMMATITEPTIVSVSLTGTDVRCFGFSDGDITTTISGGTTPYTFAWNNSSTTQNISGLATGTYNLTTTDVNLCTNNVTVTIAEPNVLSVAHTATINNCFGNSEGSITTYISGGTTPYTFAWNNSSTTQNISGLVAGTYSLTTTDVNLCTNNVTITITEPSIVSVSLTGTDVNCFGVSDGAITTVVFGGTTPYTFAWNNSSTTQNISGLVTGTYNLTTTDANSCTNNVSITITEPSIVSVSLLNTDISCFGFNDGAVTPSIFGGTTPYTFAWNNSSTTQNISGLAAGTYNLTTTDANLCVNNVTTTITEPSVISLLVTTTQASCAGSDGTATIIASGGTGTNYTYNWQNGQTTATATGLPASIYVVTVQDESFCEQTVSAIVNNPAPILIFSDSIMITCFGGSNGLATIAATGGTTPYFYNWANGSTTSTATGLSAGILFVTVNDNAGCSAFESIEIIQPTQLQLSMNFTSVLCFGQSNGTASAITTGGTTPYAYLWEATTNNQTTSTATGLVTANYSVTITDDSLCTISNTISVTQPFVLSITTSEVDNICFGDSTGKASASVFGGTSPFNYLWSNGQTDAAATGLFSGAYTITVTDNNSCFVVSMATITEPIQPISTTLTGDTVLCFGNVSGTINALTYGGTSPYFYYWDNNTGNQTTAIVTGLGSGAYLVTTTDNNGCKTYSGGVVNQPTALAATSSVTNLLCFGSSSGQITTAVVGGTTPYQYNWSTNATTSDINGLSAGNFTVTVTDINNCSITHAATITEPISALNVTSSVANENCGASNGSVSILASGGTSPYSYLWSAGQTTSFLSGISSGNYSALVIDANNCISNQTFSVNSVGGVSVTAQGISAICNGTSTGSITTSSLGSSTPFTYTWSNGLSTPTISGVNAGIYTVTVTDTIGCIEYATVTIGEPLTLIASNTVTNVLCFGDSTGEITTTIIGGTTPYQYNWTNNATTNNITGLSAGSFSLTVTDVNNCTIIRFVTITEPLVLSITSSVSDENCGENDGAISILTLGGTSPYSYFWQGGETTNALSALSAGSYDVSITDANNCISTPTYVVNSIGGVSVTITEINVVCDSLGSAISTVLGAATPYTYNWSTGSVLPSVSGLNEGIYTLTVTDTTGCMAIAITTITGSSTITADFTFTQNQDIAPSEFIFDNLSIDAQVYSWNFGNGFSSQEINPSTVFTESGNYQIVLFAYSDSSKTCSDSLSVWVTILGNSFLTAPLVFSPNGDGINDAYRVDANFISSFNAVIFNRWGTEMYSWNTINYGWDGRTYSGKEVPQGTYFIVLNAVGIDGVKYEINKAITLVRN